MANIQRTSINLDRDLLEAAANALGTTRVTDTVHAAMSEAVRRRKLEALTELEFPDTDLEQLERLRQPRSFDRLLD